MCMCTLSHSCFELAKGGEEEGIHSSIVGSDPCAVSLSTAKHLTLIADSISFIETLVKDRAATLTGDIVIIGDRDDRHKEPLKVDCDHWVTHGNINLKKKDRQDILSGKELSDLHVNAYQSLLKTSFPSIHGLQNTLLQHKSPLLKHTDPSGQTLQVVHVRKSHWAALQVRSGNVELYDSAYTSASAETLHIIAQLVRCKDHELIVQMMNVAKQSGTTDCGLYAVAILTYLAMNTDPLGIVLNRQELRQHFC